VSIEKLGAIMGLILSTLAVVGLAVRFILVPYLRENLVKPLQRTEHAVTANGHRDPENPTMRDQFADVKVLISALDNKLDGHLAWSNEETSRLWRAISDAKRR
jgi:hypothetical protein